VLYSLVRLAPAPGGRKSSPCILEIVASGRGLALRRCYRRMRENCHWILQIAWQGVSVNALETQSTRASGPDKVPFWGHRAQWRQRQQCPASTPPQPRGWGVGAQGSRLGPACPVPYGFMEHGRPRNALDASTSHAVWLGALALAGTAGHLRRGARRARGLRGSSPADAGSVISPHLGSAPPASTRTELPYPPTRGVRSPLASRH